MGFFSALFGAKDNTAVIEAIKDGAFLVDVRSSGEFASGSVKGAINIPLDNIQNQLAKFKGKKQIVVFCRSGNRSSMAKGILAKNGISNVVDGGSLQNVNNCLNG